MKLDSPAWLPELFAGLAGAGIMLGGFAALAAALLTEHWRAAAWVGVSLACFFGVNVMLMSLIERGVRRNVRRRGEPTAWLQPGVFARILPAIPLTQVVYAVSLISALFARKVEWRGIRYEIDGRGRIRLVEYHPYGLGEQDDSRRSSL
jgi:branched-subunit amino acid ABC-type transport system permease component